MTVEEACERLWRVLHETEIPRREQIELSMPNLRLTRDDEVRHCISALIEAVRGERDETADPDDADWLYWRERAKAAEAALQATDTPGRAPPDSS